MRIDWFTVAAQLINFFILVWLLKRFLYKPVLHAIDARERRIAQAIADADAARREAETQRDTLRQKNEDLDRQRDELLAAARDEAGAERRRLVDAARLEADAMSAKRRDDWSRAQRSLADELARRTAAEVLAIARQMLSELAGAGLEERLSEAFVRRLRGLDGEAKATLAGALNTASAPAVVRSAAELPPAQRDAIQRALNEIVAADMALRFETAPAVIGGIELIANGRKVAWSIAASLTALEKSVADLLAEQGGALAREEEEASLAAAPARHADPPGEAS